MTLLYSPDEDDLRSAVRSLLADRASSSAVLARVESAQPYDLDLWKTLAQEIGVAGLLVPEEYGGAGATAREAGVVMEELGRAVAPVPFFTSSVLATKALLDAGAGEELERLAAGEVTAALLVPLAASPYKILTEGLVAGAEAAEVHLRVEEGVLYRVEGATVEVVPSLDLTRPVARVSGGERVARLGEVDLGEILGFGAALLASEQLGVAEWCLETTLAYVKQRYQFARPVGSFQAIKHRLADLWLDVVRARAAARNAVAELSPISTATAASWNSSVAVHVAEEAVQLHGGIGMTWEHPVHLYLKRAKADEIALGTPGDHREALAGLVGLD
ncbi:acyl-CoA dehydrogenase family protein [Nonomuraea sp. NPDC050328]|uniref:acyl-CoA dehydrogenase family protein n=1 Tax=Nonomuraea sp. NPDC050328 TaxID=3364361 RepID=UPI00379B794A